MKRKHYTEEQIFSILKEHEAGTSVADLARNHGVNERTIYRWKSKIGNVEEYKAKRQKEYEYWDAVIAKKLAKLRDLEPHL